MGKKEKRIKKEEPEEDVQTEAPPPIKKIKREKIKKEETKEEIKDEEMKEDVVKTEMDIKMKIKMEDLKGQIKQEETSDDERNNNHVAEDVPTGPVGVAPGEMSYSCRLTFATPIAHPMASKKLTKKLMKLMKKAVKETGAVGSKTCQLIVGLKSVQTAITKKNETGLMIFAGNVTPVEIMCHLPAVCEDKEIPYVFVPMKDDISTSIGIRRACIMVLVKPNDSYYDLYQECLSEVKLLSVY